MTHEIEHYEGHTIVYDHDEGGNWGAYIEDLPVCFTVAPTREECGRRIRAAITVYIEALAADRRDRPHLYKGASSATG